MKDRAVVNEGAVRTFKIVYPNLMSIKCFSHIIDQVGEHFNIPNLSDIITSCFCIVQRLGFYGLSKQENQWQLTVQLADVAVGK